MTKNFQQVEDVLSDESFLAWHAKVSDEAVKIWEQWLAENPRALPLVEQAVSFMNELPKETAPTSEEVEQKLLQLNARLDQTKAPVVRMRSRKMWWMSAAAAVLLLAGAFTFFKLSDSKKRIDTAYGEVSTNKLPDGSTIILNAHSSAKVTEDWKDGQDREVWLNGEAFFKVAKTPLKSRFIVHTGQLDVIVTGTQFNVMHRDNKTTVLLTEGSVTLLTASGKEVFMEPGDYVEMNDKEIGKKITKEESILAWKENKLSFDNTTLTDVAKIINEHYGAKITFSDDEVAAKSLTGIMPNNNLDDLLNAIGVAIDVRIDRTGKEIVFSSNK